MNTALATGAGTRGAAQLAKPLYLLARDPVCVRVQGASLAACQGKRLLGRYPLVRISRIVAARNVHWESEALAGCLAAGIPILVTDQRGNALGGCVPKVVRVSPLSALLDEFTADEAWEEAYDDFLRHTRSRVLRLWESERAAQGRPLSVGEREAWIRSFVHSGQTPWSPELDCRGLLRGLVDYQLFQAGVRGEYWAHQGTRLDLAGDLTVILYGHLLMHAGSLFAGLEDLGTAVRMFEGASFELARETIHLLGALQRWLLRRTYQWQ